LSVLVILQSHTDLRRAEIREIVFEAPWPEVFPGFAIVEPGIVTPYFEPSPEDGSSEDQEYKTGEIGVRPFDVRVFDWERRSTCLGVRCLGVRNGSKNIWRKSFSTSGVT